MNAVVPGCSKGALVYTGRTVGRGCVIRVGGQNGYRRLVIPLARCGHCRRWARVLPQELLPRKTFGVGVIEEAMRAYLWTPQSLRQAVRDIVTPAEHAPCYSSLHRWLSGLGEKALDRNAHVATTYPPSTSAIVAQTGRTLSRDLVTEFLNAAVVIGVVKYRSVRRHDQLAVVGRLLLVALRVFADPRNSLREWQHRVQPFFFVAVWDFPCTSPKTPMQQGLPP